MRARIGIHTGEAQRAPDSYVGLEVHRAARIGAAANGGQILVSRSQRKLLGEELRRLAARRSRLVRAEGPRSGRGAAPALRTRSPSDQPRPVRAGQASVHLPAAAHTALVGRDEPSRSDRRAALEDHDIRLVTLTGREGSARRVSASPAARAQPPTRTRTGSSSSRSPTRDHRSRSWRDRGRRSASAAKALARSRDRSRTSSHRVGRCSCSTTSSRSSRREPSSHELLASCPGVDLLVTSRTPLRIAGETRVLRAAAAGVRGGRALPRSGAGTRPDWTPSDGDTAAVAEICRRLDGLPLAIELAACAHARSRPASLLDRLPRKLDVVGGSVPDLPERQRTLTATIEWSYDLLDEAERRLLARLAVFAGGWTVDGRRGCLRRRRVDDVLGVLERLVEHSLVVSESGAAAPRACACSRRSGSSRRRGSTERGERGAAARTTPTSTA